MEGEVFRGSAQWAMAGYRLPGHSGVIAPTRGVHGPPNNILPFTSPRATRSLSFLLPTARVAYSQPPPLPRSLAPSLPLWNISVVTISSGKGSETPTNASGSGTHLPASGNCAEWARYSWSYFLITSL